MCAPQVDSLVRLLDANQDGRLSRAEWREGLAAIRADVKSDARSGMATAGGGLLSSLMLDAFMARRIRAGHTETPTACCRVPADSTVPRV